MDLVTCFIPTGSKNDVPRLHRLQFRPRSPTYTYTLTPRNFLLTENAFWPNARLPSLLLCARMAGGRDCTQIKPGRNGREVKYFTVWAACNRVSRLQNCNNFMVFRMDITMIWEALKTWEYYFAWAPRKRNHFSAAYCPTQPHKGSADRKPHGPFPPP